MTISKSLSVETVSTLTPASLVSGMRMPDGDDPSIIPRLDGRMLSIKDFTTILSMNAFQRDEVFGILRDIYDGSIEKPFGNGLVRRYESLFGILAGVTPTIDTFQSVHSALGERFIKYRLDIDILPEAEEERLRKVLMNISHESNMRGELQELGRRMLSKKIDPTKLPEFDEETAEVIMKCARYTAKLRSSVDRDKYTNVLTSIPTTEIATRLTKQFMKLALGVAIYYGDAVVGENSLRILRKVCIDTAPSMEEACIQVIYKEWKNNGGEPVCVSDILHKFPYCKATLHKVANDMVTLKILKQVTVDGQRMKSFFEPSKNLISMIKGAGLY